MTAGVKAMTMIGLSLGGVSGQAEAQMPVNGDVATATALENAGDVLGAAMSLERSLTRDPANSEARVYYSSLLCRLDNEDGARAEITKLDGARFRDRKSTRLNSSHVD